MSLKNIERRVSIIITFTKMLSTSLLTDSHSSNNTFSIDITNYYFFFTRQQKTKIFGFDVGLPAQRA